jgi:hypothetical protein
MDETVTKQPPRRSGLKVLLLALILFVGPVLDFVAVAIVRIVTGSLDPTIQVLVVSAVAFCFAVGLAASVAYVVFTMPWHFVLRVLVAMAAALMCILLVYFHALGTIIGMHR